MVVMPRPSASAACRWVTILSISCIVVSVMWNHFRERRLIYYAAWNEVPVLACSVMLFHHVCAVMLFLSMRGEEGVARRCLATHRAALTRCFIRPLMLLGGRGEDGSVTY